MELWLAGCAALAMDRLSGLAAIRPGPWWVLSAIIEAGSVRIAVIEDYRDDVVYLEAEGLPDLPAAVASLRARGLKVRQKKAVFLDSQAQVLSGHVDRHGPRGEDLMVEVGHFLWCVDRLTAGDPRPSDEPLPVLPATESRGARQLARAAGSAYRPWRVSSRPATFRTNTPCGKLRVYADRPGGARWLAWVKSTEPLPTDPSVCARWLPDVSRKRAPGQFTLVWPEPATTVHGVPIPSLEQLLTLLSKTVPPT